MLHGRLDGRCSTPAGVVLLVGPNHGAGVANYNLVDKVEAQNTHGSPVVEARGPGARPERPSWQRLDWQGSGRFTGQISGHNRLSRVRTRLCWRPLK